MYFLPLVDTRRVAFRHIESDTNVICNIQMANSYENESDKDLPCVGSVVWRAWRPFTRIGRAKRVGRHGLQATGHLTEDSHVAASGNAMLCMKTFRANSEGFQILCISCTGYRRYMPKPILLDLILCCELLSFFVPLGEFTASL